MKAKQVKKQKMTTYDVLIATVEKAQKGYERAKSKEANAKLSYKSASKNASKTEIKILELQIEKLKYRRKARKAALKIAELRLKTFNKSQEPESKVYTLPKKNENPKAVKPRKESTQAVETSNQVVVEKVRKTRRKSSEVAALKEAVTASLEGDDFRIIEGMGLKITQLFHSHNVKTFSQLASLDYDALKGFLRANGYKLANPSTWGEQAKLAAEGKMDELEEFKKSLSRGLKVQ